MPPMEMRSQHSHYGQAVTLVNGTTAVTKPATTNTSAVHQPWTSPYATVGTWLREPTLSLSAAMPAIESATLREMTLVGDLQVGNSTGLGAGVFPLSGGALTGEVTGQSSVQGSLAAPDFAAILGMCGGVTADDDYKAYTRCMEPWL